MQRHFACHAWQWVGRSWKLRLSFADIGVYEEHLLVVGRERERLAGRGASRRPGTWRGRGGVRMQIGRLRIGSTSTDRQPAVV